MEWSRGTVLYQQLPPFHGSPVHAIARLTASADVDDYFRVADHTEVGQISQYKRVSQD